MALSKKGLDVEVWPTGNAASSGRIAGLMQVTLVPEAGTPRAQSGAMRTAALGVFSTIGTAVRCFIASMPAKKNSLSFWMGPPADPPN